MAFTNLTMAVRKSGFELLPAIMFEGVSANRRDKNLFSEQVAQSAQFFTLLFSNRRIFHL